VTHFSGRVSLTIGEWGWVKVLRAWFLFGKPIKDRIQPLFGTGCDEINTSLDPDVRSKVLDFFH